MYDFSTCCTSHQSIDNISPASILMVHNFRVARFLKYGGLKRQVLSEALRIWQQDLIDRNQTTCNIGSLAVMQSYVVSWFEFKQRKSKKTKGCCYWKSSNKKTCSIHLDAFWWVNCFSIPFLCPQNSYLHLLGSKIQSFCLKGDSCSPRDTPRRQVRITETCVDSRTNSLPTDTPTFRYREVVIGDWALGIFGCTPRPQKL